MKPKPSPLQILDFALTELKFRMIPPMNENDDLMQSFKDYELDIDFGLYSDDFLKVYIKADINKEKKLPGYAMMAEATCIFQFNKSSNLEDEIKKSLEGFSTIYIALNSLRGLISNFTANAPFGRYILPSIDLNDLIEKKKQLGQVSKEKKLPVKSAKKQIPKKIAGKAKKS